MTNKELIKRISTIINKQQLLIATQKVVVAVSGGADSLALLHLLNEADLQLSLTAVYIDHGLRPLEIPQERTLVGLEAKKIGAQFFSISVDVKTYQKKNKTSPEEAARILRYQALEQIQVQIDANCIATAHTADDQVEEFLLRMLRGSGSQGLSGMSPKRGNIIRPLLTSKKSELLAFLDNKGISHCEDSSNRERIYLRNRVRLDLIPILKEYNPSIGRSILNISDILREDDDCLQEIADQFYQQIVTTQRVKKTVETVIINCTELSSGHKALQRRILEKVCWQLGSQPTFQQIDNIYQLAHSGDNGKTLHLATGLRVEKRQNSLLFSHPFGKIATRKKIPEAVDITRVIDGPGRYSFPEINRVLQIEYIESNSETMENYLLVDSSTISFPLTLRYHLAGERFHPFGAPGSKKVSRYLTDKKIHGADKTNFPLLTEGTEQGKIIALLGLTTDTHYKVTSATRRRLRILWRSLAETERETN